MEASFTSSTPLPKAYLFCYHYAMKQILLATTNSRELSEARDACKDFGIDVVQSELNIDEIQHHDPRKIAEHKARIHSLSPALFIRRLRMPYLLAHLNARYVWAVLDRKSVV